ncbi:MAG: NAD(P)H-dependent oxidoreductase [Muribaculaceae bacterium]|jgi:flavodoxin|nr:NAD(P)H-dependent oxidoreductase [Muribaculaceae bacterium]
MKKVILFALFAMLLFGGIQAYAKPAKAKKILVVYYSWSGNTRTMANQIHAVVGGDIAQIIPAKAYSNDYNTVVAQAKKEIKSNVHPAIKPMSVNPQDYDVIFVGTPNWWGTMAPPVATFLATHNLAGKVVIPFATNGGGGMQNCTTDIKKMCPHSTVLSGKSIYGRDVSTSASAVRSWLKGIAQLK